MGNKIHIDNELTDRGWKKMKVILDEEMPGAVPNGKPMGWMALIAFFLLSGIVIWMLIGTKNTETERKVKEQPIQQKTISEKPMADNTNVQNIKQGKIEINTHPRKSNENKISAPERIKQVRSQHSVSISAAADYFTAVSDDEKSIDLIRGTSTYASELTQKVDEVSSDSTLRNVIDKNLAANGAESKLISKSEIKQQQLPILTNQLAFFVSPDIDMGDEKNSLLAMNNNEKVVKRLLRKDSPTWGIRVGGHVEEFVGSDGWSIGTFKDFYIFKNKRISLSTGLAYSLHHKTQTKSFLGISKEGKIPVSVTPYSSSPGSRDSLSYIIIAQEKEYRSSTYMYYLDIPVSLKYHLGKRFYVSSGLNFSVLVNTLFDKLPSGDNLDNLEPYNNTGPDENPSEEFNHIDLAVNSNLGYYLTNHFDISIKYEQGLFDFYKLNEIGDFHRKFNLSMAYYF